MANRIVELAVKVEILDDFFNDTNAFVITLEDEVANWEGVEVKEVEVLYEDELELEED